MTRIKTGIIGGAGYTGGELIRILLHHPYCEIAFVHSRSNAPKKLYEIHEDLLGDTELSFSENISHDIDLLFICTGHGEARRFLAENKIPEKTKVIDLSQDHRITNINSNREFTYGLCELNRTLVRDSANIANPGCFATAIQLALLPLAKEKAIGSDLHINATTGSTGAGQNPSQTTHHAWRNNNHSTYKPFVHQHIDEISQTINKLHPDFPGSINFIPQRGSFARGIHASIYLRTTASQQSIEDLYSGYYETHPFTYISWSPVHVKQVSNTNKCFLQIEKHKDNLMITSVIDNLLKGASGQAVQNMNIMFGLEETAGLKLKANAF